MTAVRERKAAQTPREQDARGRRREPGTLRAARPQQGASAPVLCLDALEFLIEAYARLVEDLLDPRANSARIEFAYSRLLGTRGAICRLCPLAEMARLPRRAAARWAWAEAHLRDYLGRAPQIEAVAQIARRVEDGWADSIERYVMTLSARLHEAHVPDTLGILKGIDTVGLHLAQREQFALAQSFAVPLENTQAVKLRVRLLALFLTMHRRGFCPAFPAIQSYRETFRIHDPVAYPWWFVDCRLTERQLNWTFRRLPAEDLDWRF